MDYPALVVAQVTRQLSSLGSCGRLGVRVGFSLILSSFDGELFPDAELFADAGLFLVAQVYPTTTRALGLGSCSGMARVGALVTPFVAQVSPSP